ncbi:MAG: sel1 repeat family protein [Erysipelotrichaceae bacterium]|nr:sel1 repeat family protein [Erysipelotrichaceae bacterium]
MNVIRLNSNDLKSLLRYEKLLPEFFPFESTIDLSKLRCSGSYPARLEDLCAALQAIKAEGATREDINECWFDALYGLESAEIPGALGLLDGPDYEPGTIPYLESDYINLLMDVLAFSLMDDDEQKLSDVLDIDDLCSCLDHFRENLLRPEEERDYPLFFKEAYVVHFDTAVASHKADPQTLVHFRRFCDELCEREDEEALWIKAVHCFDGSDAWPQDHEESRKYLLKLFAKEKDYDYAAMLGRIALEREEYDEAFRYLSFAQLYAHPDAGCLLADMYLEGKGTFPDPRSARHILDSLYQQELHAYNTHVPYSRLADVAVRLGEISEKGLVEAPFPEHAYYYYLQADTALRERNELELSTDKDLLERVRKGKQRCEELLHPHKEKKAWFIHGGFLPLMADSRVVLVRTHHLSHGTVRISVRYPEMGEEEAERFLVTIPAHGYCEPFSKVDLYAVNAVDQCPQEEFPADQIIGLDDALVFLFRGEETGVIHAEEYYYRIKKKDKE